MNRVWLTIFGGGVLGKMVALTAAKRARGRQVVLFDDPGPFDLNADSLRNHSWLQSGLLYPKLKGSAAATMFLWGRRMVEELGLSIPKGRGIFRYPDHGSALELRNTARDLGLERQIRDLSVEEAQERTGVFHLPGWSYVEVPDTIMDEAVILREARRLAAQLGVDFRRSRPALHREATSPSGVVLELPGGDVVAPQYVVMCAGSGTIDLLNSLGLPHPLQVFRSTLLDLETYPALGTPLIVDRSAGTQTAGLAVAQHPPSPSLPDGCLVVGGTGRVVPADARKREVLPAEREQIRRMLPTAILDKMDSLPPWKVRWIAGHKTEAVTNGVPSVAPWFHRWPALPCVCAAVPGKATNALWVAQALLNELLGADEDDTDFGLSNGPDPGSPPLGAPVLDHKIEGHHAKAGYTDAKDHPQRQVKKP